MNISLKDLSAAPSTVDMSDVQGMILKGYNAPYIRYIILAIDDVEGGRQFCADISSATSPGLHITNGEPWPNLKKPPYCLNVGFTYSGMQKLLGQANCNTLDYWSSQEVFTAFQLGAAADALQMGDTGDSGPANWWKNGGWISDKDSADYDGGPGAKGNDLDIQLTLFVWEKDDLDTYYTQLIDAIPKTDGKPAVRPLFIQDSFSLSTDNSQEFVHFGYRDSLSQPRIQGDLWNNPKVKLLMGDQKVDDRPEVPADRFVVSTNAEDYNAHLFLQNGTFAAFRLLFQDEKAFNSFIGTGPDSELIAAKMCGRWRNGVPLSVSPDKQDMDLGVPSTTNYNFTNFDYKTPSPNQQGDQTADMDGHKCPYAAHIRRANPRDDTSVQDNDDMAVTHRIVRRASPYGPKYVAGEADGIQRGLVGLFIGAVLDLQFRFVTKVWFNLGGFRNNDKSPNQSGVDPIIGPQPTDADPKDDDLFAYNAGGEYRKLPGLKRFVRTDGSLYLFLPSMTGLQYLSKGTIPPWNGPSQQLVK